jgi:hypothetical protein
VISGAGCPTRAAARASDDAATSAPSATSARNVTAPRRRGLMTVNLPGFAPPLVTSLSNLPPGGPHVPAPPALSRDSPTARHAARLIQHAVGFPDAARPPRLPRTRVTRAAHLSWFLRGSARWQCRRVTASPEWCAAGRRRSSCMSGHRGEGGAQGYLRTEPMDEAFACAERSWRSVVSVASAATRRGRSVCLVREASDAHSVPDRPRLQTRCQRPCLASADLCHDDWRMATWKRR